MAEDMARYLVQEPWLCEAREELRLHSACDEMLISH